MSVTAGNNQDRNDQKQGFPRFLKHGYLTPYYSIASAGGSPSLAARLSADAGLIAAVIAGMLVMK
jgi:hypothetical protein